jgi:ribose transport system permease protein
VIITKTKLNSFIVTLATSFIFTGLVYGISKGYPFTKIPDSFTFIGQAKIIGIPYLVVLMFVTLAILYFVFKYTVTGRRLLATGGNIQAARLSGIDTDRMTILANILSGFFASIAALCWLSRMGSAQPATGQDWMIISFAVAVIGGTALAGGSISPIGLFFGGLIMVLIKNGLILLQVDVYYEQTFLGIIILLAVMFGQLQGMFPSAHVRGRKRQSSRLG